MMELLELKHKILNIFSGEKTELDKNYCISGE